MGGKISHSSTVSVKRLVHHKRLNFTTHTENILIYSYVIYKLMIISLFDIYKNAFSKIKLIFILQRETRRFVMYRKNNEQRSHRRFSCILKSRCWPRLVNSTNFAH